MNLLFLYILYLECFCSLLKIWQVSNLNSFIKPSLLILATENLCFLAANHTIS